MKTLATAVIGNSNVTDEHSLKVDMCDLSKEESLNWVCSSMLIPCQMLETIQSIILKYEILKEENVCHVLMRQARF